MSFLAWSEVAMMREAMRGDSVLDQLLGMLWRLGFHRVVALEDSAEIAGAWRVKVGACVEVRRDPWAGSGVRWMVAAVPGRKAEHGTRWKALETKLKREHRMPQGRHGEAVRLGEWGPMADLVEDWIERLDLKAETADQYRRRLRPLVHDYNVSSGTVVEALERCLDRAPSSALRYRKRFAEDVLDLVGRLQGLEVLEVLK